MSTLPITRLIFFRHGVAYVERRGSAEGHATLAVREGEMSDVLKSLTLEADSASGAPITSVSYETPEDPDVLAARRGVPDLFQSPLRALLHRLRGSVVQLETCSGQSIRGTLIGLEVRAHGEGQERERVVVHDGGRLHVIDVADVRELQPQDDDLAGELDALLAHVRGQDRGQARSLRLELRERADVRAGYVIPASPWRVVYRLHLDPGEDTGTLSAFALLHNPTDEAIDGAEVVLTTGEPQSFSLELHRPTQITRAVVQETQRGGRAPARYERAKPAMPMRAMAMPAPAPMAASMGAVAKDASMEAFGGGDSADGADTEQRGELFEYRLTTPLTLGRGRSALLPLVSRHLKMQRERLYRPDRGPHPDLVVRFDNDTGVVLEEGAAVLYEGHEYSGEAMLPLTGKGSTTRLAYGSDQAIRCSTNQSQREVMIGLTLSEGSFVEQRRRERHIELEVISERDDEVTVLFEVQAWPGYVPLPDSPAPHEETPNTRRYRCTVGPRASAKICVKDAHIYATHIDADDLGPRVLEWARSSPLEGSHGVWQAKLLQLVHARTALQDQRDAKREERERLSERRSEIAEELSSIGNDTPEEMRVRKRIATTLEQLFTRSDELDVTLEQLEAELTAATDAIAAHVRS